MVLCAINIHLYLVLNYSDRSKSFERQTRVFLLSNRSEHFGYEVVMNIGLMYDKLRYDDPNQHQLNFNITSMFVRMILGYQ